MRKFRGKVKGADREYPKTLDNACKPENQRWQVIELDIEPTDKSGKPTVWYDACQRWEAAGVAVKDVATRVAVHLVNKYPEQ
jgi:hypothetical protein